MTLRNAITATAALLPAALAVEMATVGSAVGAEAQTCHEVRLSNVGWTDITATTGVAAVLLDSLGYRADVVIASVPITFQGLANGDLDLFLGLWMPTMTTMIEPFFEAGTIERIQTNLTGAKYTLAVPRYVAEAGVVSFADLDDRRDRFAGKIYGIEPGNDGNTLIEAMIEADAFGLGDWELVESSEQGMLVQVDRSARRDEWIVFLGWEPHPMNRMIDIAYLEDGDDWFGPDFGGATVYTVAAAGYVDRCPNIGRLLTNLTFTLDVENTLMGYILNDDLEPEDAATRLLTENPALLENWLNGITTADGVTPGLAAVKAHLGLP